MFQGSLYQHKGERTSLVQDFGRCWGMFVGPISLIMQSPFFAARAELQEKPVVDVSEDEEDEDENFWDKEQKCGM